MEPTERIRKTLGHMIAAEEQRVEWYRKERKPDLISKHDYAKNLLVVLLREVEQDRRLLVDDRRAEER